jgi:hypothetical protein
MRFYDLTNLVPDFPAWLTAMMRQLPASTPSSMWSNRSEVVAVEVLHRFWRPQLACALDGDPLTPTLMTCARLWESAQNPKQLARAHWLTHSHSETTLVKLCRRSLVPALPLPCIPCHPTLALRICLSAHRHPANPRSRLLNRLYAHRHPTNLRSHLLSVPYHPSLAPRI